MENETVSTPVVAEAKAPVKLTISALQKDLKDGISRKDQAKKYGVPLAAINRAYKSTDKLKGKRVFSARGSKATNIELIDDVEDTKAPEATEGQEPEVTAPSTEVETSNEVANTEASTEAQPETQSQESAKSEW